MEPHALPTDELSANGPAASLKPRKVILYMIAHPALQLRKVGMTRADRLDGWRCKSWTIIETMAHASVANLRAAETLALSRLDQLGARATSHMESLFPNLAMDGRTEMYDPVRFSGDLRELLGDAGALQVAGRPRIVPLWISAPKSDGAKRSWLNGGHAQAGEKALATRRRNAMAQSTEPRGDNS